MRGKVIEKSIALNNDLIQNKKINNIRKMMQKRSEIKVKIVYSLIKHIKLIYIPLRKHYTLLKHSLEKKGKMLTQQEKSVSRKTKSRYIINTRQNE